MALINTPFGEIELERKPITLWINDSSIGAKQLVTYDGIRDQSEQYEFANIIWIVDQYDEEGNKLNELHAVQGRQVITPVNGNNRVTDEGLLILREAFPETEAGQRAFQMAWNKGHNEYQYWMALIRVAPLPVVLEAAGNLLAQYGRFDRI